MRPYIPCLDTGAMAWETTETPGLFTKLLSVDPENGARTAFQCIDPARGYKPPPRAHFHHMDEELFFVKGRASFDGKVWLGPGSYCYHPAETVHGFRSQVEGEAWFISRCSRNLDFHLVDDAQGDVPYSLTGRSDARGVAVIADPERRDWIDVRDGEGYIVLRRCILSRHPQTGEGSMLVRFMPGWQSPHGRHFHTVYEEVFVLEGELETDDGATWRAGAYMFKPPLVVQSPPRSPRGALAYINFGGALDFLHEERLARLAQ